MILSPRLKLNLFFTVLGGSCTQIDAKKSHHRDGSGKSHRLSKVGKFACRGNRSDDRNAQPRADSKNTLRFTGEAILEPSLGVSMTPRPLMVVSVRPV